MRFRFAMRLIARCCGVMAALGATALSVHSQTATSPDSIGPDAWVTQDLMRSTVLVHQPAGNAIVFRVPRHLQVDLNLDSAVLCGRDTDHMWLIDLMTGQLSWLDIPDDRSDRQPWVKATQAGACATPATDTSLKVLNKSGQSATTRLVLPSGHKRFEWTSLGYDDAHDGLLAIGSKTFAVIPAAAVPSQVAVQTVSGKLKQGSIENTHFSSFGCCSPRLAPDGQTLLSVVDLGDEDMSGFTGLAGIDVTTGQYRRMYLPLSPQWQQTGKTVSRYGKHPWFELAGSTNYDLWSQQQGSELVLSGFAGTETEQSAMSVLTVNLGSGKTRATPQPVGTTFEGLTASGRFLVWRGNGASLSDKVVITDAHNQTLVREHPGRVIAVAHAKSPTARMAWKPRQTTEVQSFQSTRAEELGFGREQLGKIAAWLKSSKSLEHMRLRLLDTTFQRHHPVSSQTTVIGLAEVVAYAQGLSLPNPETPYPSFPVSDPSDQQAWGAYITACERHAQAHGSTSQLALLQCLVAPW